MPDDSNIYILSNTTVRVSAYDISVSLPGGLQIKSTPIVSTDSVGNLWAHVIVNTLDNVRKLYGVGAIEASVTTFPYKYIWHNASGEEIPLSYTLPVLDSSGYIYVSSTYGVVNQYQAYLPTATPAIETIQSFTDQFVMNGTSTNNYPPIQVSATPLIDGKNTMYVIATDRSSYAMPTPENNALLDILPMRHYLYTLSG